MAANPKKKNRKKKKEEQVIELTPEERFVQLQTLKRATRCMLVEQDVYDIYVKLTKDFAELDKIGAETPFEGCEQCAALSEECGMLAEEWKKNHRTERTVESQTVTTSAKERETNDSREKGKGKWIALAVLVCVIACIVCYQVDATRYLIAGLEEAVGFDDWAMSSYKKLGDYKDCEDKILEIQKKAILATGKGHTVNFGKTTTVNAKGETKSSDCVWIVLDKQGDKVLLAKQTALSDLPYHETKEAVTWEQCTARRKLNSTFVEQTFSPKESALIMTTEVTCNDNGTYKTKGGGTTSDKIFIMNEEEVRKYSKQLGDKCKVIRLRTPGKDQDTTTYVSALGRTGDREKIVDVIDYGFPVELSGAYIRPVMWVDCK